ncbi:MAG: M48 family metalloprotease [Nitrososphaerota archaeon]|nr:M48 family metalloprotease [Candidatus Bathyarchaeota archaeon]MDW8061892.1 M48 family metalloprotease [Nitrososphaerota archaeon]
MSSPPLRFLFEVEAPRHRLPELIGFIEQMVSLKLRIPPLLIQRSFHLGYNVITFTLSYGFEWSIYVVVYIDQTVVLDIYHYGNPPIDTIENVRDAVRYAIRSFEDHVRRSSIFLTFVESASIYPDKYASRKGRIIERLFSDNMLPFFLLFMMLNIMMFAIFQYYAPFILVLLQFIILLNADKIMTGMADWALNENRRRIHIVQYVLSPQEYEWFVSSFTSDRLMEVKKAIFEETLALGSIPGPEVISKVFSFYGFQASPDKIIVRSFDIFDAVEDARTKYNLPRVKLALINTLVANAAATGIIPWKSAVIVTTGLLAKLDKTEIEAVIGHELSHVKNVDPFILFIVSVTEYLLRVYVLYPVVILLPFVYFPLAFFMIYFVGKFLEARADLESAIKLGNPKALAEALYKIGYSRLIQEKAYGASSWLNFDPHPPLYFRIKRLESMTGKERISHITIKSIYDVLRGFLSSI